MKNKIRIGINGFGRIGRITTRIILSRKNLVLAAINSRADTASHAYLLKYDSIYASLRDEIKEVHGNLRINKQPVEVYNFGSPAEIPWSKSNVDIVIDTSGKFRTTKDLSGHLNSKVKYVVLSAPAKDDTKTLVLGVNEHTFNPKKDQIISNSSCTTNCLATTLKVLDDNFQVVKGYMTTIHAVTDSQNLLDNSHKKEARLRRAAFLSLIPSSTGSAKDIFKLFPKLKNKIICQAIRIPTPTVSMINLTAEVKRGVSREIVNKAFIAASKYKLKNILSISNEELVSRDFTQNSNSSIVDLKLTQALAGSLINVYAWYDNEWGYSSRLTDMAEYVAKRGLRI